MQRNRDDGVAALDFAIARPQHPGGHHWRKVRPVTIFQAVHQVAHDPVMSGDRTKPVEGRRICYRFGAQDSMTKIVGKRAAEHLAIGTFDEADAGPAIRAEATVSAGCNPASGAARRIKEIRKRNHGPPKAGKPCRWRDFDFDRPHMVDISLFLAPLRRKSGSAATKGHVRENAMDIVFDQTLIAANRRRAFAQRDPKAAFLLDIAANEMAERLSVIERRFDEAVELHGATGAAGRKAIATGKIRHLRRIETNTVFAAPTDAITTSSLEEVPLEPQSVNLVLSPLSLHLTNDTPGVFIQIRLSLKPDGVFFAAIPGAGTLQELRDVLLATEIEMTGGASPRVIPFADVRDIGGLMQRAGFTLPVVDAENYTVRYDSLFPLMRDLRAMGMANPLIARSRKPLTRRFFLRAAEIYAERYSDPDGRIRATFSIIYASGWAPHESQQKPLQPGSAKARLADALKVEEHPLKQ